MPTSIHYFDEQLSPELFDQYLASGWRSTGQSLYTSDFLRTEDDELYGCVQIRLPLADHAFTARQRKLMNRNARRFTFRIEPAGWPDQQMLSVNRKYMRMKPENSRDDLDYHVFTAEGIRVLDTWTVKVYDEARLAGFSYFDLGRRVMYSKAGIYDPYYHRSSLGIYTMLLEVEFARERGVSYYHPGYISRGYPKFHYKADLGPMEYRDVLQQKWLPLGPERAGAPVEDPYEFLRDGLRELQRQLRAGGLSMIILEYPGFTARYSGTPPFGQYLDGALIGLVAHRNGERPRVVNYHFEGGQWQYVVAGYAQLYDTRVLPRNKRGEPRQTRILQYDQPVFASASLVEVANGILEERGLAPAVTGY